MKSSFNCFRTTAGAHGAHSSPATDRMAFKTDIATSKDDAEVSSYRESIGSKLGELKKVMLDVEEVPALKTMELQLSKVYESMKEVLGGHGQKRVAVVSVSGDTRACKRQVFEDLYAVPDDVFAEFEYSLEVPCDASLS